MSGKRGDGVNNINGEGFLGVQVRPLDELVRTYIQGDNMQIAWAPLNKNPFRTILGHYETSLIERSDLRAVFTSWCHNEWEGTRYDLNLISLGGSIYSTLRPLRAIVEKLLNTDRWLFCSELVFTVLQTLEFYNRDYDPRDVLPMDLVGYDTDESPIPTLYDKPLEIIEIVEMD